MNCIETKRLFLLLKIYNFSHVEFCKTKPQIITNMFVNIYRYHIFDHK